MSKYLCEFKGYTKIGDTLEEAYDELETDGEIPHILDCNFYELNPIKVKLTIDE